MGDLPPQEELTELGYDYANFRAGLELGPSWFKFQLHAGMSYMTGQVKQLGATLTKAASSEGTRRLVGVEANGINARVATGICPLPSSHAASANIIACMAPSPSKPSSSAATARR